MINAMGNGSLMASTIGGAHADKQEYLKAGLST